MNGTSYKRIAEQWKNFAKPGGVIAISGSGNSPNVLRAIEYAKSIGCKPARLTARDGGKLGAIERLNVQVAVLHMGGSRMRHDHPTRDRLLLHSWTRKALTHE